MSRSDFHSLAEVRDVILGGGPVDLAAAALNGDWVSLQDCDGLDALLSAGIGAAAEHPVISLQQAQDAAGTGAKVLNLKRVYTKVGAPTIGASQDVWTRVSTIDEFDNQAASYNSSAISAGDKEKLILAHVRAQDLDINGGFTHVRLQVADVGITAQLGTIHYIPAARSRKGIPDSSMLS